MFTKGPNITIDKTVTDVTHTGDTVEFKIYSILIPANSWSAGDIFEFMTRLRKSGTAGALTIKIRFGTTNDLAGTVIATTGALGATTLFSQLRRAIAVKDATHLELWGAGSAATSDDASSTTAVTSLVVDLTVDNYLVVSVQNANAGDTSAISISQLVKL